MDNEVVLRTRPGTLRTLRGAALVVTVLVAWTWLPAATSGTAEEMRKAGISAVLVLVPLAFLPWWLASHLARLEYHADATAVTFVPQDLRLRLADLTRVRVGQEVATWGLGAHPTLVLSGPDQHGRDRTLRLSGRLLGDLSDVAEIVSQEVRRRPDLTPDEHRLQLERVRDETWSVKLP